MKIYKITNQINEKFYVGKEVRNRPSYLGSGTIIRNAVKKYGEENFKKEYLEKCADKEQLKEREIYWINKLKPPYNLTKGGDGGIGGPNFKGKKHSKESRKKMSRKISAYWGSPEGRKRKSKQVSGENNPMYGKKHSEKTRQRIREKALGNKNRLGIRHTEEAKQKMSKKALIRLKDKQNHPCYGKPKSKETKRKISETKKRNYEKRRFDK